MKPVLKSFKIAFLSHLFLAFLLCPITEVYAEMQGNHIFATLKTSRGNIKLKLFRSDAPRTVENFVELATGNKVFTDAKTGKKVKDTPFYRDMIFHKVHPELGIQTGCPFGNGKGGPGFTLRNEANELKFDRGFLMAMAKLDNSPNSAGSQFFITTKPVLYLNGRYTVMGEVVDGHEVVIGISEAKRDAVMRPVEPIKLIDVIIEGVEGALGENGPQSGGPPPEAGSPPGGDESPGNGPPGGSGPPEGGPPGGNGPPPSGSGSPGGEPSPGGGGPPGSGANQGGDGNQNKENKNTKN